MPILIGSDSNNISDIENVAGMKPAVHTGVTFDKIIIDLGGLKMSYIGPDET